MRRAIPVAGLALVAMPLDAQAQASPLEILYDSAYFNWDAGDYPTALRQIQRVLAAPGGDIFLPKIAELTGEVYRTDELALDGRSLRWSANSAVVAFESGTAGAVTSQVFRVGTTGATRLAEIPGHGLALSPDGERVAYLALPRTAGLERDLEAVAGMEGLSNQQRNRERQLVEGRHAVVRIRELADGREREVATPTLARLALAFGGDGRTLYLEAAAPSQTDGTDIYEIAPTGGAVRAITEGPGNKSAPRLAPGGRHVSFTVSGALGGGSSAGPGAPSADTGPRIGLIDTATGRTTFVSGSSPSFSADGSTLAWVTTVDGRATLMTASLAAGSAFSPTPIPTMYPPTAPVLSPDGRSVAFQGMPRDDWEIFTIGIDGQGESRVTRDIQHDLLPQWLHDGRVFAVVGESRHRRSFAYDPTTNVQTRLFHNNTVRTVAPEYEWSVSPDGSKILFVADRDGNTISLERGVYLMDLERTVPRAEVEARIAANLAGELDLRARGEAHFRSIADAVRTATSEVSVGRIYSYAHAVYQFDSKNITQPGNHKAIAYYESMLRSFGYEPEVQWYEPRPGIRSANIVATIPGTVDPELIYVVSSHFDSVERGPGADDNSSGSTALLEAARVLKDRPGRATIRLVWLTGEESGLLGAREFVRRSVENGDHIVGVLNNDMVGWTGNHRLDNTIRYSNDGIRDIQHAAAMMFSDLITYDARYYRSTDAGVFYEAYGDIVGGIGSYPILSSPYYHQTTDILSNINQPLVAQVSKTTVATIMLLSTSPSRPTGLTASRNGRTVEVSWDLAPETGVTGWVVEWVPAGDDGAGGRVTVERPAASLPDLPLGAELRVKAIGPDGMESWDWARITVE